VTEAHELGATVGAWNALIRRARIGRDRKAAAFVVSSYARADGTQIHCGVARLAVDLEIGYSTARRYLAWMRQVGLIELVRAGNRRRNLSDEYRLILGPNVLEHIDVLDPAEHKKLTDGLREANRGGARERATKADQRSAKASAETAGSGELRRSPRESAETTDQRSLEGRSALALGERPPLRYTSPKGLPPRNPDDEDLGRSLTVGARETENVVELFPGAAQEAPYRPPPGASRAQAAIDAAMARRAAARQAHRAKETS
jgi:hypothetical protein